MARFTDVSEGHWAYKFIEYVASHSILSGYGDGRFGPSDALTREQLAASVYRAVRPLDSNVNPYTDIDGNPFKKEILALTAAGVFTPADGKFNPKRFVTRGELAVVLAKGFKFRVKPGYEANRYDFHDMIYGHWARESVKALYTNGVLLDVAGGDFRPNDNVFREDLACFIYRSIFFDPDFVPGTIA